MLISRSIILSSALCASAAVASVPLIPPPEPARLVAAEQLVEELPLEKALGSSAVERITGEVADSAIAWLSTQLPDGRNEMVDRIFHAKVRIESKFWLTAAINDARVDLADKYARRLSERELKSAHDFAATPEGKTFLEVQLDGETELRNLVSGYVYRRAFPSFPAILQSAQDSSRILDRVNKQR